MKESTFWKVIALAAVLGLFYVGWGLSNQRQPAAPSLDWLTTPAFADAPKIDEFEETGHTFLRVWNDDGEGNLFYRIIKLPGITANSRDLRSTVLPELISEVEFFTDGRALIIKSPK
ncbi:MAG: hypothetical protein NTW86_18070 [Candidatus Sumerlaeota bacterium]|nr:hypothetical protein [Candidatus Sumerlaeota bacterium]